MRASDRRSGRGSTATAAAAPLLLPPRERSVATAHGAVSTPKKFDETVSSRARAASPPAAAVRATPLESVVGMQKKTPRPVDKALGSRGTAAASGAASAGVSSRIDARPKSTSLRALSAPAACSARTPSTEMRKMPAVASEVTPRSAAQSPGAGKAAPMAIAAERARGT